MSADPQVGQLTNSDLSGWAPDGGSGADGELENTEDSPCSMVCSTLCMFFTRPPNFACLTRREISGLAAAGWLVTSAGNRTAEIPNASL